MPRLSALALALLLATPALAQTPAIQPSPVAPDGVAAGAPVMQPHVDVDESALRFYASQNDRARVDAETRRLKALYPGWTVPDDLYAPQNLGAADEQPLWELFAADRLDELVALMEARKKAEPDWEPSRDLAQKVRRKVARSKVLELWNAKEWKKLVAYAQNDPTVGEIGDVDVLWTLAEGFANARQRDGALRIYSSILSTSNEPAERIGTVLKAMANLAMSDAEKLIAMGRTGPDGKSEFEQIRVNIVGARITAFLRENRKEDVSAADLALFEAHAKDAPDADQAGLVAWYRYKRGEYKPALEWFKHAMARGGDGMIAHGLAHTLRELGYQRETEEIAYAWRESSVHNRALFIDILVRDLTRQIPPFIESERLARYGRITLEDASGEGALALAWYAYNSCQFEAALEWFERAVAWAPKPETVFGYAATLRKLKREKQFLEVVNRADGLHPEVMSLLFPVENYGAPPVCETASWDQVRWWDEFLAQNPWIKQANDAQKAAAKRLPGRVEDPPIVKHGEGPYSSGQEGFVEGALHDPLKRYSWGVVTAPSGRIYPQWRPQTTVFRPPPFNQQARLPTAKEFPLPVLPENPLRFAALTAPAPGAPGMTAPPAQAPAYAREPFAGPYPLVARRVAGVGPMPYEKHGIQLLPNPEPGKPLGSAAAGPGPRVAMRGPRLPGETTGSLAPPVRRIVIPVVAPVRLAQLGGAPTVGLYAPPPPTSLQPQAPGAGAIVLPQVGRPAAPVAAATPSLDRAPPAGYPPQLVIPPTAPAPPLPALTPARPARAPARPLEPRAAPAAEAAAEPAQPAAAPAARRPPPVARGCRASLGPSGVAAEFTPSQAVSAGWCLLNAGRPAEAGVAFDRALGAPGRVGADAAYGKSLALLQANDPKGAAAVASQAPLSAQRRGEIGVMALEQRVYDAYNKGDYLGALGLLRQRGGFAVESRDLTLIRAWSLYQLGKFDDAERLFRTLDAQMSTRESRSGLSAIENKRQRMP